MRHDTQEFLDPSQYGVLPPHDPESEAVHMTHVGAPPTDVMHTGDPDGQPFAGYGVFNKHVMQV